MVVNRRKLIKIGPFDCESNKVRKVCLVTTESYLCEVFVFGDFGFLIHELLLYYFNQGLDQKIQVMCLPLLVTGQNYSIKSFS